MSKKNLPKELPLEKEIHLLVAHKKFLHGYCEDNALNGILAGYKVPTFVKIAGRFIYGMTHYSRKYGYTEHDMAAMIERILHERQLRLNKGFEWTEENKAKFLFVNDQIYDACVKAWEEAKETAAALEKRIKRRDSFLKDYEIEITLNIYPGIGGRGRWVSEPESYLADEETKLIKTNISHSHYKKDFEEKEEPILIGKNTNWNFEYPNNEFDNHYICYAIHVLLETDSWSVPDILSVEQIWVDVNVAYQHGRNTTKRQQEKFQGGE